jgi:hypothetical protein
LRARLYLLHHHLRNGLVAKLTDARNLDVSSERAYDIAFGQNPDYLLISIGDYWGAYAMLVEKTPSQSGTVGLIVMTTLPWVA